MTPVHPPWSSVSSARGRPAPARRAGPTSTHRPWRSRARTAPSAAARPRPASTFLSAPLRAAAHLLTPALPLLHPPPGLCPGRLRVTSQRAAASGSGPLRSPGSWQQPSAHSARDLAPASDASPPATTIREMALVPLAGGAGLRELLLRPNGTLLGLPGRSTSPSHPSPSCLRLRHRSSSPSTGTHWRVGGTR